MREILAYWPNGPYAIKIETDQLRGKVITVIAENRERRKELYYDGKKEPYIVHRGKQLQFCERERERLGI